VTLPKIVILVLNIAVVIYLVIEVRSQRGRAA
jgi:hypothetical protein